MKDALLEEDLILRIDNISLQQEGDHETATPSANENP